VTVTLAGALPSPRRALEAGGDLCAGLAGIYVTSWTSRCDQALANRSAELGGRKVQMGLLLMVDARESLRPWRPQ
jgi:hypothetical protein